MQADSWGLMFCSCCLEIRNKHVLGGLEFLLTFPASPLFPDIPGGFSAACFPPLLLSSAPLHYTVY